MRRAERLTRAIRYSLEHINKAISLNEDRRYELIDRGVHDERIPLMKEHIETLTLIESCLEAAMKVPAAKAKGMS